MWLWIMDVVVILFVVGLMVVVQLVIGVSGFEVFCDGIFFVVLWYFMFSVLYMWDVVLFCVSVIEYCGVVYVSGFVFGIIVIVVVLFVWKLM